MAINKDKNLQTTITFVEDLKRRWMETVDALIDPLIIVDKDYKIAKANKALAQNVGEDEVRNVVGKTCYKVFAKRKTPCPGCKMNAAWETGKPQQYNLENFAGGKYIEAISQPLFNSNGEVEGTVQVYRDRTEAKNLQEQLLQSEKLASIGLLAGGIAHEINNPLGGILIFSQMLLRELDAKSSHYQDVLEIEAATQRCKAIVESLLEFARAQPRVTPKEQVERVDVRDAIMTALKFVKVGHRHADIEIVERWSKNPLLIMGSRGKVIQLFLNLIRNSYQAMPKGGKLELASFEQVQGNTTMAVFEVKDTGVGIAKKNLTKIFDPFYTSKGPGEGTGLGLSICHGIAEDMKGVIEVSSKVNHGTTFRFIVPKAVQNAKKAG